MFILKKKKLGTPSIKLGTPLIKKKKYIYIYIYIFVLLSSPGKKNCNRTRGKPTNSQKISMDGKPNIKPMTSPTDGSKPSNPQILTKKKKNLTKYIEIRSGLKIETKLKTLSLSLSLKKSLKLF